MNVAIVGFATEGIISAQYYAARGHDITVCDADATLNIPQGYAAQLGPGYLADLDRFDVIVRTAGLPPRVILEVNPDVEPHITTALNEFMGVSPTKNIIGVTGTKGKGTTSTLITEMLKAAGKTVHLGGNIGRSPLEFVDELQDDDWVVLETSSFQLIDVQHSPHIAVCLMVVPEHLNWHADMAEYIAAKSQLFAHQTSDDVAIYFAENDISREIAGAGEGQQVAFYTPPGAYVDGDRIVIEGTEVCKLTDIRLLGEHNWQNVCAAVTAVWQAGVRDVEALRRVITSFSGLEHRLEFVRELDGVQYFDDSFGTTPETAIVALQAFVQPKIAILGGSDKGASYTELAEAVASSNVRAAILIGDEAEKIKAALAAVGYTEIIEGRQTMTEIVDVARGAAKDGDIVLLSTGCASFGMFENYKDRGDQFKAAVQALG